MSKRSSRRQKNLNKRFESRGVFYVSDSLLFFVGISVIFLLVFSLTSYANYPLFSNSLVRQNVLGEDDEDRQTEEAEEDAEEQEEEEKLDDDEITLSTRNEGNENETEIETPDGQKIKTKVEDDGTTNIEIEQRNLKIKYEVKNGQVLTTTEDENGDEVELNDDQRDELEDEIEDELDDDGIQIATRGAGQLTFAKNQIAAKTFFPLSIDVGTKQLVVSTPVGQKIVTVLPDQAVAHLLAAGIIDEFNDSLDGLAPETGNPEEVKGVIKFEMRDGLPVYEVDGFKTYKLFALIPVTQPLTAIVSSETGEVVGQNKPLLTTVVDLLSP